MTDPDLPGSWLLLSVAARTTIVLFALLFGVRLFGKRQVGGLNVLDVAVLLLMANAVQNALTYGSGRLGVGLMSAGVLLTIDRGLDLLFARRPGLERRLIGEPTILLTNGRLDRQAMRREGVDEDELAAAARAQGLPSLADVRAAVLENDGTISIVPKDNK